MSDVLPLDAARLEAWAQANVPGFCGPVAATKFATGQSNPTYLIETPSRRYVLRRKPPGKLLKSAHAVEREFRVLRALEGVGFPAPRALALCEDESVVGSVFYLMSHVEGRIFWDPALPGLAAEERTAIYDSMNAGLARLHAVDVIANGLGDYGKPGDYFARQLQRWTEQYRASETEVNADMDRLIAWLGANARPDDGRVALVHGDWRIDNMIYDNASARIVAVLDWELSTLGHPFADLAYQCMQWRMPNVVTSRTQIGDSRGLGGVDRAALGIPTESEYVDAYCRRAGIPGVPGWTFLLAFSFFRYAAIAQGVYKRSLDGNASNPERARKAGQAVPMLARLAIEVIEQGA
jgi:aminoglycoside phosphotransferase (APT) family kinase protein